MAVPALTCRIDWANLGTFGNAPYDTVVPIDVGPLRVNRGRSSDYGTEAIGAGGLVLDNDNQAYTPDRNWHDNPSFEVNTAGWSTAAIAGLTASATSITRVADNAGQGGSWAGEAVLTSTVNSGVAFAMPWSFLNPTTYSASVWLKSVSGNLNVRAGLASAGTPADLASGTPTTITTSWAQYTFTWPPSADRTDAVFFLRTTTAGAATVRIDAAQVNPTATLNPYLEAPTKGQLVPGRPVHIYATWAGTDYPLFYGFIERLTPYPEDRTVELTCYDVLRRMSEVTATPMSTFNPRSARDLRIEILGAFEAGTRNLLPNPSFATDTSGWTNAGGGTLTRITSDAAPPATSVGAGQFVATTLNQYVEAVTKLQPMFPDGGVYQASVWLKSTSGNQTWTMYGTNAPNKLLFGASTPLHTITVTPVWQRFSASVTTDGGLPAAGGSVGLALVSTAAGTILVDAAMITRGGAVYPYSDTGSGRWPNAYRGGGFDGLTVTDWVNAWHNSITNGSFEAATTGWSVAGDAFTVAATSLARTTAAAKYGIASGLLTAGVAGSGAFYAVTGTFPAGLPVKASVWLKTTIGINSGTRLGIGSQGAPTDFAEAPGSPVDATNWMKLEVSWQPAVARSDVHLYIITDKSGGAGSSNMYIDGAMVLSGVTQTVAIHYADAGPAGGTNVGIPGGGGGAPTTTTSPAKYGSRSMSVTTSAIANSGIAHDGYIDGMYFPAGQPHTLSLWLNCASGTFPYKVALSANKNDGTFEEVTATGTVTAGTWTQVTLTLTPTADRSSGSPDTDFSISRFEAGMIWITIVQTNATARTFYVDGVRLIPAATADEYEMAHWAIPQQAEPDILAQQASNVSGTVLSLLSTINGHTLSRHWIKPAMAAPWYAYVLEDRDTYEAKVVAETVATIEGWESTEIDRASIVNVVPVSYTMGTTPSTSWYSDPTSVDAHGPRPVQDIGDATFWPSATGPDAVAASLLRRYARPRTRPVATRINVFPELLARDLSDVLSFTVTRYGLFAARFAILSTELAVTDAGNLWTVKVQLEEFPF